MLQKERQLVRKNEIILKDIIQQNKRISELFEDFKNKKSDFLRYSEEQVV